MNRTLIDDVTYGCGTSDIPAFNPNLLEELRERLTELMESVESLMDIHSED